MKNICCNNLKRTLLGVKHTSLLAQDHQLIIPTTVPCSNWPTFGFNVFSKLSSLFRQKNISYNNYKKTYMFL